MQPVPKQRVAVFGGTFDPVHLGHLIVAEQCREQAGMDQVWFVPAARPPHKQERAVTPFAQRVEMLALAVAGNPAFHVSEIEKDRPGPSYTADTLAAISQDHAELDLSFILGSDSLPDLPLWRDPLRILELARLLVVARPGWPVGSLQDVMAGIGCRDVRAQIVQVPLIDIASRDLRRRVARGRGIRYLVPRAVEVYIREKQLYRGGAGEPGA